MRVKNFAKFQHFKDRRPPWIKLYRDILDDMEWHELDGDSAKTLVMIWVIASENSGALPEKKNLAFRLRMTESRLEQILNNLSHWLELDDIKLISARYQDVPATESGNTATVDFDAGETETETETENEAEASGGGAVSESVASCPVEAIVSLYHELLPDNPRCKVLSSARKAAIRARWKEASGLDCKPFGYKSREEGLFAWKRFFKFCAKSEFLMGKVPAKNGNRPFIADIDFLMSPSGFARTLENKYHSSDDSAKKTESRSMSDAMLAITGTRNFV